MMIPTSLYIHIPWCVKKCPYCDFNSHEKHSNIDEMQYVTCLVDDFVHDWQNHPCDTLHSIFIGGGTPSLFSPEAYECLLTRLKSFVNFAPNWASIVYP